MKLVILDRDGTLIEHVPYLSDPTQVKILEHSAHVLKKLIQSNIRLAIVTNQSLIGRGYGSFEMVNAVNAEMEKQFEKHDVYFDDILICPHEPEKLCPCRKPNPYQGYHLMNKYQINPSEIVVLGDQVSDMRFATNIGANGIMLSVSPINDKRVLDLDCTFCKDWYAIEDYLEDISWISK